MTIIKDITRMLKWVRIQKKRGKKIGLVPTMGYLHEGHLSLSKRAKQECSLVVMSIFVNPIQFGPREDFKKYPRNLKRDIDLASASGVDVLFCPASNAMYPADFLTSVNVDKLTDNLCGRSRPGHFRGVTTVVAKLFNIVQPDIAYFGQKDAQQAVVIKQMVADLNFPIKVRVMPIVREKDGLAMSSRNIYLSESKRRDALVIYQALKSAKRLIFSGELDANVIKFHIKNLLRRKSSVRIDYVEIVNAENLKPLNRICGKVLIVIAVIIGKTRLIDNIVLRV